MARFSSPRREGIVKLAGGTLLVRFLGASLQRGVIGINAQRELRVALGIFVTATNQGIVWQCGQFAQAGKHFGRGALDQTAASEAEQRIARQKNGAAGEEVTDLTPRVAGRVDDLPRRISELNRVTFLHRLIELRQPVRVSRRADHLATGKARAHDVGIRDVVAVVMRQQDEVQLAARRLDRGDDRRALGGVDDGRRAGFRVAQEPGIVIIQNRHRLSGHGQRVFS